MPPAGAHEVAGRQDAHVLHGDTAVGQGAQSGFGGQVDGVLVRVLPELGHVDPEDPDVFSCHARAPLTCSSVGLEPEPDGLGACLVGTQRIGRQPHLHAQSARGRGRAGTLITLARTLVPSQSITPATKGTGMPGAANDTIVKVLSVPLVGDVDGREALVAAGGAGVAAVEEPGPARLALVGHQMRITAQDQIVHERNLLCHADPFFPGRPSSWPGSRFGANFGHWALPGTARRRRRRRWPGRPPEGPPRRGIALPSERGFRR